MAEALRGIQRNAVEERRGYRPRELARLYNVAPATVYKWIYEGKVQATRRGRVLIVSAEEVERWFNGSANAA